MAEDQEVRKMHVPFVFNPLAFQVFFDHLIDRPEAKALIVHLINFESVQCRDYRYDLFRTPYTNRRQSILDL